MYGHDECKTQLLFLRHYSYRFRALSVLAAAFPLFTFPDPPSRPTVCDRSELGWRVGLLEVHHSRGRSPKLLTDLVHALRAHAVAGPGVLRRVACRSRYGGLASADLGLGEAEGTEASHLNLPTHKEARGMRAAISTPQVIAEAVHWCVEAHATSI